MPPLPGLTNYKLPMYAPPYVVFLLAAWKTDNTSTKLKSYIKDGRVCNGCTA